MLALNAKTNFQVGFNPKTDSLVFCDEKESLPQSCKPLGRIEVHLGKKILRRSFFPLYAFDKNTQYVVLDAFENEILSKEFGIELPNEA